MKTKIFILLIILGAVGYGGYRYFEADDKSDSEIPVYNFAKIERKTIQNMVSSTGTLAARELVEIGSQVSGTIEDVYSDFNDTVEVGQLIALIDPSVLDAQVKSSEADVLRQKANLKKAKLDYERFKPVNEKGFLSGKDFLGYEVSLQTAEASVMSAEASLERIKRSREFAEIRAPISGVIIDRNVEKGQTVATSFNTPRLFIIAEDLGLMEILANVDESDIGQIKTGQEVRFTVAAYPERTFVGQVTEIRLQPQVIQNVVNYTVVVETENPRRVLLPGMTATLDFVVEEVENVVSVPASALSLKMNDEMIAKMQKRREEILAQRQAAGGGEGRQRGQGGGGAAGERRQRGEVGLPGFGSSFGGAQSGGGRGGAGGNRRNIATLWYLDGEGELQMLPVRTGVTDGLSAEVLPLQDTEIEEGLEIIAKVLTPSTNPQPTSVFGGRSGGLGGLTGGRGPGGGGGGRGRGF
ncbi:MAG: efflux RND transporter periplasmic adaptor subunit [Verrucomicrobia bacterium TMED71]|nr:MAG: efflux RND transporter periplasmic adaptor subunit [Verrucomicrobia bacterium TMED71]